MFSNPLILLEIDVMPAVMIPRKFIKPSCRTGD